MVSVAESAIDDDDFAPRLDGVFAFFHRDVAVDDVAGFRVEVKFF